MNNDTLRREALTNLSSYRREKSRAISHERGQAQSIGAALLLDQLLGELGLHERDMTYEENEHGKPSFSSCPFIYPLSFNLSHSAALAAAALLIPASATSALPNIGLDIQRTTHYRPELVRRVFSTADRQRLGSVADTATRERLFTQLWCRAEAYAKATGEGLRWPFPPPPATARFYDYDIDDYSLCLCICD